MKKIVMILLVVGILGWLWCRDYAARRPAELGEKRLAEPARAGRQELSTKIRNLALPGNVCLELRRCPAGVFTMGSPLGSMGRDQDETEHLVTLDYPFWMGKTKVTQAQWEAVMVDNPSNVKGRGLPVEQVSWNYASEFCKKLTEQEAAWIPAGYEYRLPTEAEWEYACRAASLPAVQAEQSDPSSTAWGLADMPGTLREWCHDWYSIYSNKPVLNPTGPVAGVDCDNQKLFLDDPGYSTNITKLDLIVIPTVALGREATLAEIVRFLKEAALDNDPEGKGIDFFIANYPSRRVVSPKPVAGDGWGAGAGTGAAPAAVAEPPPPPVQPLEGEVLNTEISGTNLPLQYVMKKVVEFYNGRIYYEIDRYNVTFFRPENQPVTFVEREWKVAPSFFKIEEKPQTPDDLMKGGLSGLLQSSQIVYTEEPLERLEAEGIVFREDGDSDVRRKFISDCQGRKAGVSYNISSQALRVFNGREELDRIDHLITVRTKRVIRGGGAGYNAGICRAASRQGADPNFWNSKVGFRIVLAPIIPPPKK